MKPTVDFLNTLGQYVYKYIDNEGNILYIGKGNGSRCLAHLSEKGYSLNHCYIVARNLERFEGTKDWQSFLLESYLIENEKPRDNSVSGRYKECFIMAGLSTMFSEWKAEQFDNFETLPSWYIENYNRLRGRVRLLTITSNNVYIESTTRNSIKMLWYSAPNSDDEIKVTFEILHSDDDKIEYFKNTLKEWLKGNGYPKTFPDGKKQKLAISVSDIDAVLTIFDEFNS